jgi:hypothetical protein
MKTMKDLSDSDISAALVEADGNVSVAAVALDVLRGELWNRIQQSRELLDVYQCQGQAVVEDAQTLLREGLQIGMPGYIKFVLRTLGRDRGYGKYPAKPLKVLPPNQEDEPVDLTRMKPEEARRFQYLANRAAGFEDGIRPPDPDWVQRLDQSVDAVRTAFARHRYNSRQAAAKLGVDHDQLQEYLALRPALYDAIGDPREEMLDCAVKGLHQAVRENKPWAVILLLRTQGRALGYGDDPRDEIPRQRPKSLHADDFERLTNDELVEYDELRYVGWGKPLPHWKALQKAFRESIAEPKAQKEKGETS